MGCKVMLGRISIIFVCIVGHLIVFSSSSFAQSALLFTSKSSSIETNAYCRLDAHIPHAEPVGGSSADQIKFIDEFNRRWSSKLTATESDYLGMIRSGIDCLDASNVVIYDLSFEMRTPVGSAIMSISFGVHRFFGGAHGYRFTQFEVFDQIEGVFYPTLSYFIDDQNLGRLKDLLEEKLVAENADFDPKFGWNSWKAQINSTTEIANFYFDQNGLKLYFNQYEIAPYSAGPQVVSIGYSELRSKSFLRSSGPALKLPQP